MQYNVVVTGKLQPGLPKRREKREVIPGVYNPASTNREPTESYRVLASAVEIDCAFIMVDAFTGILPQSSEPRVEVVVDVNAVVSVETHCC